MCMPAFRTSDPADAKPDSSGGQFNVPIVIPMNGKTGTMPTGARQLMKLELINNRIIKRLRKLIAILSKNGYHSIVDRHR